MFAKEIVLWRIEVHQGQVTLETIPVQGQLATLDDTAPYLPQGAYTTFRTYQHDQALRLGDHFARLRETAALSGYAAQVDEQIIHQALRQAIAQYPPDQELRLRLLLDLQSQPGTIYLASAPLHLPSGQDYQNGVKTVTCSYERRNPKAKLTGIIADVALIRQGLPPEVNEALIIDPVGMILEGLSSNFFAVKNGEILTAEEQVLSGITRQIVLEQAELARIPVHRRGLPYQELTQIQEAFITSASREVLPVRQVDEILIGQGVPGSITRLLGECYRKRVGQDLEQI